MIDDYAFPKDRQSMADFLKMLNIGYDFQKDKPYNWDRLVSSKEKHLEKYYLATILSKQLGDISKISSLPDCDLLIYSFPCTDISTAGLQKGFKEDANTRSGLVWQVLRLLNNKIENEKPLPKYLLMENVKNLVGNTFINDFNLWNGIIFTNKADTKQKLFVLLTPKQTELQELSRLNIIITICVIL